MKIRNVRWAWVASAALALMVGTLGACKGHVEKDANGEVTSVGVKTDPQVTEKVKEAGEDVAAAGRAVGKEVEAGAEEAGKAIEKGAKAVGHAAADAALVAKVKAKLLADPEVKGLAIEVQAEGGKVVLSGKAENKAQKQEAGKLARNTQGVTEVRNRIKIAGGG